MECSGFGFVPIVEVFSHEFGFSQIKYRQELSEPDRWIEWVDPSDGIFVFSERFLFSAFQIGFGFGQIEFDSYRGCEGATIHPWKLHLWMCIWVCAPEEGAPVAFESRGMTPAEQNYPVGEQELLAVVHVVL